MCNALVLLLLLLHRTYNIISWSIDCNVEKLWKKTENKRRKMVADIIKRHIIHFVSEQNDNNAQTI